VLVSHAICAAGGSAKPICTHAAQAICRDPACCVVPAARAAATAIYGRLCAIYPAVRAARWRFDAHAARADSAQAVVVDAATLRVRTRRAVTTAILVSLGSVGLTVAAASRGALPLRATHVAYAIRPDGTALPIATVHTAATAVNIGLCAILLSVVAVQCRHYAHAARADAGRAIGAVLTMPPELTNTTRAAPTVDIRFGAVFDAIQACACDALVVDAALARAVQCLRAAETVFARGTQAAAVDVRLGVIP
jgi:hypothetical protein